MAAGAKKHANHYKLLYKKKNVAFCDIFLLFYSFRYTMVFMNIENISLTVIKVSTTQYPSFPSRLQFAMALRNYSTQQLANRIFLTHSTISGYRNGTRMPSVQTLCDISRELDVSVDFLLCLTDYTHITPQQK